MPQPQIGPSPLEFTFPLPLCHGAPSSPAGLMVGDPVNAGAKWPNSTLKCETEDGKRACLCGGQCKAHLLGGRVRPGHCCESLALLAQCRGCPVPSSCNVTCTPGSCWKERVLTPRARVGPRPGTPGELRWFVEGPLRPPDLSSQPPCLPDDCKRQTTPSRRNLVFSPLQPGKDVTPPSDPP